MASTLRDELASLKIERPGADTNRGATGRSRSRPDVRAAGDCAFLSWLLWLIPLGSWRLPGCCGYKQYDQMRSRPEVTWAWWKG